MLKTFIFAVSTAATFFTTEGFSVNSPTPLGQAEGFVIHSSTSVSNLEFEEGRYTSCENTSAGLEIIRCQLEGAQITLTGSTGPAMVIPLSELTYYQSASGETSFKIYTYRGLWKITQNDKTIESKILIRFNQTSDRDAQILSGFVSLKDLDISEPIQARLK